jgi:hypothetical protein
MSDWISIYCPHCRRHTSLREAPVEYECTGAYSGRHKYITGAILKKDYNKTWWIGVCNSCREPVLVLNEGEVIYPHQLPSPSDSRIPEHIRNDLDEAKICFSVKAYRSSAVMSRRGSQSACIDKGATKEKLVEQLHELAANRVITNDLKEWADVVRWVGNDAAHPDKQPVTEKDAEDMLKLSEQFLHVIYVAPAIAKEQRIKRGKT